MIWIFEKYLKDARDACSSVNGYLVQAQDASKQAELEIVAEVRKNQRCKRHRAVNFCWGLYHDKSDDDDDDLSIQVLHSLVAPWSWWIGLFWDGVGSLSSFSS